MKTAIMLITTVLVITGCSTTSQIDGDYNPDIEYILNSYSVASPTFNSQTRESIKPALTEKKFSVSIRYPEFRKSSVESPNSTPTTNLHTLRKINDELYLLIQEKNGCQRISPIYYDKENQSIYEGGWKYIRKDNQSSEPTLKTPGDPVDV